VKNTTKIVAISIILLLGATVALWFLTSSVVNRDGGGAVIAITGGGEIIAEADMEFIKNLERETFEAVIRSSGQSPVETDFTGALLRDILSAKGVDFSGKEYVLVKGVDLYVTRISVDEIFEKDIYIAYEMGGKPLRTREQRGTGPFQLVIPCDPYSLRWCKFVCEVEVI